MHSSATTKSVHTNTMMPTKEEMIAKYGVYFARLFGLLVIVFPVEYGDTLDRVKVAPMRIAVKISLKFPGSAARCMTGFSSRISKFSLSHRPRNGYANKHACLLPPQVHANISLW